MFYSNTLLFIYKRQVQIISPRIIRDASSFDKFKIIREDMTLCRFKEATIFGKVDISCTSSL